jgi:hypothetical protein
MQGQQFCHRTLQRKRRSLREDVNAVQFAEVTGVLSGHLNNEEGAL